MNKPVRIALGLAVSAFCLWFVFKGFDFRTLADILRQASYVWLLLPASLFVLNMTLRSFRWRTFLTPLKWLPIAVVMPTLLVGFLMNFVLPARGGELVRSVALARRAQLPTTSLLGSVVAERLTDLLGLLLIICLASRLLPWSKLPVTGIALTALIGFFAAAGFVVVARRSKNWHNDPSTLKGKIAGIIAHLTAGFLALQSPKKLGTVVLLSFWIWINEALMALLVARALHFDLGFFESAGVLTGLSVGVMIPAAPGYVGTYEFFGKSVLGMLGKPAAASLGFVLVLHFFHTVMTILLGVPSLLRLEMETANDA